MPSWASWKDSLKNLCSFEYVAQNFSPYDIHDTLLDMLGYHQNNNIFSRKGQSVYKEVNGLERNCDYYSQDIMPI